MDTYPSIEVLKEGMRPVALLAAPEEPVVVTDSLAKNQFHTSIPTDVIEVELCEQK